MMAPACSLDDYEARIRQHLGMRVPALTQYSLTRERALADSLDVYGKSLLNLVSNAIEARAGMPLLGLEERIEGYALPDAHQVHFAGRDRRTDAKTHRGFDADPRTMNHLLESILGVRPKPTRAFRAVHLTGY